MTERETYSVGYKKPPVQHRFKPGVSGNPRGRPRATEKKDESSGFLFPVAPDQAFDPRTARRLMLRWLAQEKSGGVKSSVMERLVCDTYAYLSGAPAAIFHKWLYERGRG